MVADIKVEVAILANLVVDTEVVVVVVATTLIRYE
jgi:hypothetical protein